MSRRVPIAGTVRPQRFSRSRRLAPPETMQGLFHPRCALGVLPDLGSSHGPFDPTGLHAPGFPLHGLLLPRDEHVLACSPVLRFVAGAAHTLSGHIRVERRALHGLDHRRIGVSPRSDPGVPAILRFSANDTLVDSERLLGSWVSPRRSGSVTAPIPLLQNLSRPHLLQPHEPASRASDPTTNRVVVGMLEHSACQRSRCDAGDALSTNEFVQTQGSSAIHTLHPQRIHRSIHRPGDLLRNSPEFIHRGG